MDLATRIDEAERMAKADCSVETIAKVSGLSFSTASCIRSRVTGQQDPEALRKHLKD